MQRILFATDLTSTSLQPLQRAVRLAMRDGASLRIVHAVAPDASEDHRSAASNILCRQAREIAILLSGSELDLSVHLSTDDPETAILQEAERFDPDLIILGGHGEPKIRDALFGTTATHMVRCAGHAVLVVQNSGEAVYSKVMLGIDDAASAKRILHLAAEVAPGAELFAVHAFEPTLREIMDDDDAEEKARTELQTVLSELARNLPGSPTPELCSVVRQGDAMTVLEQQSKAIEPDLIVMGTHGRSGFAKLILGSVADDMLFWCTADVLVMPLNFKEAAPAA